MFVQLVNRVIDKAKDFVPLLNTSAHLKKTKTMLEYNKNITAFNTNQKDPAIWRAFKRQDFFSFRQMFSKDRNIKIKNRYNHSALIKCH